MNHTSIWESRRTPLWLAVFSLGLLWGRCVFAETPPQADAKISKAVVTRHVQFLASPEMRGRSGPTARKAAEYIRTHFQQVGLAPLFAGGYFQSIPAGAGEEAADLGRNVGGWLPGS
ncbi:MAG: hypothetical protein ABGZ17_30465, partial [Planctomycetaceae bacterium]